MAALPHQQILRAKPLGFIDRRLVDGSHLGIVAGEQTIVGPVEAARTHGPLVAHTQNMEHLGDAHGGFDVHQDVPRGRQVEVRGAYHVDGDFDVDPMFIAHFLFDEADGRLEGLGGGSIGVAFI